MKKLFLLAAVIILAVPAVDNATWEHDKCRNLEAIQETVPDGLTVEDGECFKLEPIVDQQPAAQPAPAAPQPALLTFSSK
jgi:hypothetical protein